MAWRPATVTPVAFDKDQEPAFTPCAKRSYANAQSLTHLSRATFFFNSVQCCRDPYDADLAVIDATQNAVLHKEVVSVQGGDSDKDVTESIACPADTLCDSADASVVDANPPTVNDWFVMQDNASALQPLVVLLMIIGLIVFFLSRKSTSTK